MRLTFFFSTSGWFTLLNFFNFRSQLQRLGSHKVVVLRFLVPVGFLCDHSSMEKYFWVRSFELMTIESSMHALSWLLPYMPNDQLLSLFIHELLQFFQPTTSDILVSWLILLPLILIDFIILSLSPSQQPISLISLGMSTDWKCILSYPYFFINFRCGSNFCFGFLETDVEVA